MRTIPTTVGFGLALLCAGVVSATTPSIGARADGYPSMPGRAVPAEKSVDSQLAEMFELHGWLEGEAAAGRGIGFRVDLSRQDRFLLGQIEDCEDCGTLEADPRRYLVGVDKPISHTVDLTQPSSLRGGALQRGALRFTNDGLVWTTRLSSPGAAGLRIHVSGLDLPPDAALYVFNHRGEAFGPYLGRGVNGSGEVTTNLVSGDTVFLQLRSWGTTTEGLRFRIEGLGHISNRFDLARDLNETATPDKVHCTSGVVNASCVENAECYGTSRFGSISNLRKAIAAMLYRSGGSYYICTGGLLNNTSNAPLFLTANHCLSKGNEASSLEVYWNHTVPCGQSSCGYGWAAGRTVTGSTILSTNRTGDYSLLQLNSNPPTGAYKLGWNATPVATTSNLQLHRISHPQGAPQAYSESRVNTSAGTCSSLPRGTYIYSTDNLGATEGGSSGSPVLNGAGEVVGQLYGACGTNLNNVCDSNSNRTVDGAFAGYFSAIEGYLTSGGGGDPDPDPDPPPTGFVLSGTGTKVQGRWVANLSWTGSSASSITIVREGSNLTTVSNSGSYTDSTNFRGSGSLTYRVCEAGTSTCSNTITLSF